MKKTIAWLVLLSMILMAFAPLSVFADEPEELERAIKISKEKFSIAEELNQFNYDVEKNEDTKVWTLSWSSDDRNDGNVRNDMVIFYNIYKPSKYEGSKLPAISREQARERAEAFMEGLEEGIMDQVVQYDNRNESLTSQTFHFSYKRIVDDIPFYENTVNIEVDKNTGQIKSYYRNWDKKIDFPSSDGIIGIDDAQEAYKDKIGLELIYKYKIVDEKVIPYLVYVPREGGSVWIDAFTGEKISASYYYMGGMGSTEDMAVEAKRDQALTPEEVSAIDEISNLISGEEAEKILKSLSETGLDDEYELVSSRLEKAWPDRNRFRWFLSFKKTVNENGEARLKYGYGSVDAENGEILNFENSYDGPDASAKVAYSKEESLEAVEKFLEKFVPDRMDEYVYENSDEAIIFESEESEEKRYYSFTFTRMVDGIPFRSNTIRVGFDAVEGRVLSYNLNHFYTEFPSAKDIAPIESAYDALNEKVGMELLYVPVRDQDSLMRAIMSSVMIDSEDKVKLAYGLKAEKPAILDAEKLVLLNQSGDIYREVKISAYDDLEGEYSKEAVETLAENGIYLEGESFNPRDAISQKDFFLLLIHTMGYYVPDQRDDEFITQMYDYLVSQEIIAKNEIDYDSPLRRVEAVKYIVRGLGYEKIALLENIFSQSFADVEKAYPKLRGYVAIANGLGIVRGYDGKFNPEAYLKRGDAAIMIYNRLRQ